MPPSRAADPAATTPTRHAPRRAFAALAAAAALVLAACSGGPSEPEQPRTPDAAETIERSPSLYIGGGDNVFRQDISSAPAVSDAPARARKIAEQVTSRYNGVAGLNVDEYSATMYVADANTPRIRMEFDDCQKKGYTPLGLFDGPKHFENVPVPANAVPTAGTDKALSIVDPVTDQLWEFWVTEKDPSTGRWSACWGGRIDDVSQSQGRFQHPFGATASGLPMVGSMVTIEEARRREIPHAVSLVLVDTGKDWSWPANRSDGRDPAADAIPLGSRLRLDPSVDVDALSMDPVGKAIAKAAQKYGFLVVDTSGAVSVIAQNGTPAEAETGTDPWTQVLGGTPTYEVLKGFPWDKVQLIEKDYGKPADAESSGSSAP